MKEENGRKEMREDQATSAETARVHPEQAEGAQGEREASWSRFDPTFLVEHLRRETNFDADLIGKMLEFAIGSAALAQPSPAPEGFRGVSGCLIDAAKNGHLDGWGISREEWYAAARLLDGKQSSPAPELERPEVVAHLRWPAKGSHAGMRMHSSELNDASSTGRLATRALLELIALLGEGKEHE